MYRSKFSKEYFNDMKSVNGFCAVLFYDDSRKDFSFEICYIDWIDWQSVYERTTHNKSNEIKVLKCIFDVCWNRIFEFNTQR
jgi:hypothetical protein